MIAVLIILALLAAVIVMLVKFKKANHALRVLFVFLILISVLICAFIESQRSLPIKSLPLKALPQDFTYNISPDEIEKINNNTNSKIYKHKYFNGMEFAYQKEELHYYKGDAPLQVVTDSNERSELLDTVADSYFTMLYFDFYTEENAEKAMEDILFTNLMQIYYTLPCMDEAIDRTWTLDGDRIYYTCDVADYLTKTSEKPNIVSAYSLSTTHSFGTKPLLSWLPGDDYISLCAFRDGQYILVVYESAQRKETNMFSVLGNTPTGKMIVF